MIGLKNILRESKTLHVYDFDDTLVHSDSTVGVTKKDGTKLKLTADQYAVYKEDPGDKLDFSDFNKMLRNPKAIRQNVKLLKRSMSNPQNKVTVLTAREIAFPLRYFFKNELNLHPYVVGVAGADPKLKVKFIEDHIKKGYTDIFFIDDSPKNVRAVNILKSKYPNVRIKTELAKL